MKNDAGKAMNKLKCLDILMKENLLLISILISTINIL